MKAEDYPERIWAVEGRPYGGIFWNKKPEGYEYKEVEYIRADLVPDVDWEAYRRELAKECMAALIGNSHDKIVGIDLARLVDYSVQSANALIDKLKSE